METEIFSKPVKSSDTLPTRVSKNIRLVYNSDGSANDVQKLLGNGQWVSILSSGLFSLSELKSGDRVVVKVDEDGTHIYNTEGVEVGTFTDDGIVLGDHDGLHVDINTPDGTMISGEDGTELIAIQGDTVTIGHTDGLHIDVADQGKTNISDGNGNHIIEIDGANLYFKDLEGNNHFKFNSTTKLVSIMSPDGTKTVDFTNEIIDAINALV